MSGFNKTKKIPDSRTSFLIKTSPVPLKPYRLKLEEMSDSGKLLSFMTIMNAPDIWEEISLRFLHIQNILDLSVKLSLISEYIHTIDMYLGLYSNQKQIKATATGFFNQTVHNIRNIIGNKEAVQWNIYSAHDTTVGNMLAALNLTNVECIY